MTIDAETRRERIQYAIDHLPEKLGAGGYYRYRAALRIGPNCAVGWMERLANIIDPTADIKETCEYYGLTRDQRAQIELANDDAKAKNRRAAVVAVLQDIMEQSQ